MSYDLLVFDPAIPPPGRDEFLRWFKKLAEWDEDRDYDEPAEASDALRAWFMEMITEFPAMNGSFATDDHDSPKVTGYTICRHAIYTDFRWSEINDAYRATFSLAKKHRLGFFDASADDGQVWLPEGANGYAVIHGSGSSMDPNSPAQRVAVSFRGSS
jgi:hypothetical protein